MRARRPKGDPRGLRPGALASDGAWAYESGSADAASVGLLRVRVAPRALFRAVVSERAFPWALASLFVVSGLSFSFWWPTLIHADLGWGGYGWDTPMDLWATVRDARMVDWGDFAGVYGAGTGLVTLPGIAILLAPFAALASALHLSFSFPFPLPYPTAWYVIGPVNMVLGAVPVVLADRLAVRLGLPSGPRLASGLCTAVFLWPMVAMWGHPEDALALAGLLGSILFALEGRWVASSFALGAAICFQLYAALAVVPIVVYLAGLTQKQSTRLVASALWRIGIFPGALGVITLAGAPASTLRALLDQPNYPLIDWPTPWVHLAPVAGPNVVEAGPVRWLAVGSSFAVGAWLWHSKRTPRDLVWAVGVALAARSVFEAVMVPYYIAPGLVLLLAAAGLSKRAAIWIVAASGCWLTVFVEWRWDYSWWWYLDLVAGLGISALAAAPWLGRLLPASWAPSSELSS